MYTAVKIACPEIFKLTILYKTFQIIIISSNIRSCFSKHYKISPVKNMYQLINSLYLSFVTYRIPSKYVIQASEKLQKYSQDDIFRFAIFVGPAFQSKSGSINFNFDSRKIGKLEIVKYSRRFLFN